MTAPLHQLDEGARLLEAGDLLRRAGLVPARRLVRARGRQILAHVAFLVRLADQRMGLDLLLGRLSGHVAHAGVAGQPAALVGEHRHLAVVDHHRQAILVERRLGAAAHCFLRARPADEGPLLAVVHHVVVHLPGPRHLRLPLEAEVQIGVVMGGLDLERDRAELAGDRDRFVPPALDEGGAEFGLLALVAGQTGFALPDLGIGTLVLRAAQPAVIDLPGIEQRHRLHRDGCPVSGSRGEGRCRCSSHTSGECCGAGSTPCRCSHHFSPSDPGTNMRGGCRALAIAALPCPPAQGSPCQPEKT